MQALGDCNEMTSGQGCAQVFDRLLYDLASTELTSRVIVFR